MKTVTQQGASSMKRLKLYITQTHTNKSETVEQFLKRGGVVTVCRSHRAHNAAAPTKIKSYATSSMRPKDWTAQMGYKISSVYRKAR